jgi:tetratricopeptide (TPR) repeat protein
MPTRRHHFRLAKTCCLLAACLVLPSQQVAAQDAPTLDQRYVKGLRERGLLELAERTCRKRLDGDEKDVWTGELLRVLAERALVAQPQERAQFWREAEQLAEQFSRENGDHPRAILIEIQLGLNHLARGQDLRIYADLVAAADVQPALTALADSDRAFKQIDEKLQVMIAEAGTRRSGGLNRDDLFALQNKVVHDRSRIAQQRGLCYPSGSEDRAAAMGEALEFLKHGLTRLDRNSPLAYRMKVERAICFRELGDPTSAFAILAPIARRPVDDELVPLVRSERLRLAIARNDATTVQRSLNDRDPRLRVSVDWKLARLEGAVFLWKVNAENEPVAKRWRGEALAIVKTIEVEYGGYWARRANRTLIKSATGIADLEVLQRRADEFYLRGQLEEALASYDKATAAAVETQNQQAQFLTMYRAAKVVQQLGAAVEFRSRLKQIATELPDYSNSDDAHLLLIRELVTAAQKDPKFLVEYYDALTFHIQQWPMQNTSDQVRVWLGMWQTSKGNAQEAIRTYRQVSPRSVQFSEALDGLRGIWMRRLTQHIEELDEALQTFKDAIPNSTTEQSVRILIIAAWSGAQLSLYYDPSRVGEWQLPLADGWTRCEDVRLKARMMPTYLAMLVETGNEAKATSVLDFEDPTADLLFDTAQELVVLVDRPNPRPAASKLLLQVIERLRKLSATEENPALDLWEATAADVAGESARAVKMYRRLLKKTPADVAIRRKLAKSLGRSADAKTLADSLNEWRIVASGSPKGEDSWLEARFQIAQIYLKLGNRKEAVTRVRYLLLTSPPEEPWKSRFEKLLEK